MPQESAARESQSRRVLRTPYNHAPCHFMQSHIRKMYACLAVTCHLRFWQNDRGLLRATAVTRGWNGYRNKSQHRKLTLEKKILPPLQQGFEPATFRSRVRRSNHWAIPDPQGLAMCTAIYGNILVMPGVCFNRQWTVLIISLYVSVHFAGTGSAAIYGNILVMPGVCFNKQGTVLIISLCICTLCRD